MWKWHPLIVLYVLISITHVYCKEEITTRQGIIKGREWTSQNGRKFMGFTGIPYAKPPIGKLRFQAPVPSTPWNGILDATNSHNPCPQADYFAKNFTFIGNEDCLYLNVYKPLASENFPVMFYIHGGSFNIGSGADNWTGPQILMDRDVVLVVVNYRLGALGFLCTEDVEQPGNNGLKDQALALKWVKENIKYFGGDDLNITVFGNSVGGMSAHYFTMSPMTKDLLTRVIIQSGVGTTVFPPLSKGVAKAIAKKLGSLSSCSVSSTKNLINCLQEVDVVDIIRNGFSVVSSNNNSILFPFQPVIEVQHSGAFLSDDPIDIVMSKRFANVPILIGIVEAEGAYRSAEINTQPELLQRINNQFESIAAESFPISQEVSETAKAIRQFYFGNETINNSSKLELSDLFSDGWVLTSLDLTLYLLLQHKFIDQPIYVYLFGYRGSTSYTTLYGESFDYGVCHTDELLYLLPRAFLFPNYQPTKEDLSMANTLRNLWFDFAKIGNPTPASNTWKPLNDEKLQYLHIKGPNNLFMEEGLFATRRKFWKENVYQTAWANIAKQNVVNRKWFT